MRKVFTSLIVLFVILAIAPAAAWADSIALGPSNTNWLQTIAINSTGTGTSSWNQFQMQFNGAIFLGGFSWNGGSWTYSTRNNVWIGSGPANWNSTLTLTVTLLPLTKGSFYIDVLQFSNGTLLSGADTRLTWTGGAWSASNRNPTQVPEPQVFVLLGVTALVVGGALRNKLV
jgi:hypothetical protein